MKIVLIDTQLIEEAMRLRNEGFVRLPIAALRDKRLTMTAAAVLAVVLDAADNHSAELSCAQIAAAAGCSVRAVKSSVQLLEECGYIRIERRQGACSSYSCPDVLPPKRRWKNAPQEAPEGVEEYKAVIGKFLY